MSNYLSGLLYLTENSITQELWQKILQIQSYLQGEVLFQDLAGNITVITDYVEKSSAGSVKVPTIITLPDGTTINTTAGQIFYNETSFTINNYYADILYKYKDLSKLSSEALTALIAESGYKNITEMLDLNREQLLMLASYAPLIKFLKGSRAGIELILELFSAEYEIREWWEDDNNPEEYTFKVNLWTLLNMTVSPMTAYRFVDFCRSYVYPVLTALTLKLLYTYKVYTSSFVKLQIAITVFGESRPPIEPQEIDLSAYNYTIQNQYEAILTQYIGSNKNPETPNVDYSIE